MKKYQREVAEEIKREHDAYDDKDAKLTRDELGRYTMLSTLHVPFLGWITGILEILGIVERTNRN